MPDPDGGGATCSVGSACAGDAGLAVTGGDIGVASGAADGAAAGVAALLPPNQPWLRLGALAAPTVTMPEIWSSVCFETPARWRSATDVYGRPAMIFFAVAGPTPGSASSCDSDAALRSTGPPTWAAVVAFTRGLEPEAVAF